MNISFDSIVILAEPMILLALKGPITGTPKAMAKNFAGMRVIPETWGVWDSREAVVMLNIS